MEDAGIFSLAEAGLMSLAGAPDARTSPESPTVDDTVLIQTVDFITPVLDDPYAFGQAAAANALGDIYAMGGRPISALNLVAFPAGLLSTRAGAEILAAILRGGRDKIEEAGAALLGGHTVDDAEPKYGLAVTGVGRRSQLLPQSGGRPGDVLLLTKPIGGGVLATALKRDGLAPPVLAELTLVLTTLNAYSRDAALAVGARAATDVTGFGLLGHLSNLVLASGVGAEIEASAVPVIPAALALAGQGPEAFPTGARRNLDFVARRVDLSFEGSPIEPWRKLLLADPMTSGGLLVAVAEDKAEAFSARVRAALLKILGPRDPQNQNAGAPGYWCSRIGRLTSQAGRIVVTSERSAARPSSPKSGLCRSDLSP